MSNDVVLSAALRNNLLSLQSTQNQIDTAQQQLASGKKVNSALDNPQEFFASQSLNNAASDLSNLLDSIGQSIQVINAANNGVTALTSLVTQAQAVANSAQSTLAGASTQASVTGSANLGTGKLTSIPGIASSSELLITVTDPTGAANPINTATITIGVNDTASDLVTRINDLNTGLSTPAVSASLDTSNHLILTAVNGGTLAVKFGDTTIGAGAAAFAATTLPQDTTLQSLSSSLGFGSIAALNQNGAAATNDSVDFTQTANSTISSQGLYTAAATFAQGSTLLTNLKDSTNTAITSLTGTDTLTVTVGGKTSADLLHYNGASATSSTIQNVVDGINNDANIKSLVSASFNSTTGQIQLTPLSAAATGVQLKFSDVGGGAGDKLSLKFGVNTFTPGAAGSSSTETINFGAAAGTLASLQTQYNTVLSQINSLVNDTGYAGTNLLNGNNLVTYFNANRTSSLTTSGSTFNTAGLGLTSANFQSSAAISTSVTQTQSALTTIRNFGGTLANNLSVIQNRQSFTTSTINTLQTGSSALTNADQNAVGAQLLALETRQSLGITSLSLASQAQQAILKLF